MYVRTFSSSSPSSSNSSSDDISHIVDTSTVPTSNGAIVQLTALAIFSLSSTISKAYQYYEELMLYLYYLY